MKANNLIHRIITRINPIKNMNYKNEYLLNQS